MKLATWNVNSVRARMPRLLPWLEARRPDVLCLQELKCVDEDFPRAEIEALGYRVETFGQKTYNGVAILSLQPMTDVVRWKPAGAGAADSRVIAATIGDLRVIDAYVVNGQEVGSAKYAFKLDWLAQLHAWLKATADVKRPLVVTGDFNITFDDRDVYDPEEWRDQIFCSAPERAALAAFVDLGLVDVFRRFHEEGGHYTWWDFRTRGFQRKQGLRIDHLLVSEAVRDRASGVEIDLAAREGENPSDHAPVILTLKD